MSKAVKQITIVLIVLLIGCMGFAFFSLLGKKKAEERIITLQSELDSAKERADDLLQKNQITRKKIEQVKEERNRLKKKLEKAEAQVADLLAQIRDIKDERDRWQKRSKELIAKRDELLSKIEELKNRPPKIKIIYREKKTETKQQHGVLPKKQIAQNKTVMLSKKAIKVPVINTATKINTGINSLPTTTTVVNRPSDEEYWASVLKDKAALEVEIAKLKEQLSAGSLEVVEVKQKNKSLELELESLKHDKGELEREIEFKTEMITNLSIELAKAKNDKKFISDRVEKLNQENVKLRDELKKLVKANGALEKTIIKIKQEKRKIEAQLGQTEELIQSKIDEIWQIKESLDKTIKEAASKAKGTSSGSSVELAPIVVRSSSEGTRGFVAEQPTPTGFNGKILSVNEPNNFVIINLGEKDGIRLGDRLSVYRDGKYIARIEVIQVRPNIAAADLKDQWTRVRVGDSVR